MTRKACAASAAALAVMLLASAPAGSVLAFDLQGHRGARGLAPENTLTGFAKALEIGVTTLEADLAVTRDGILVVSHDATLNSSLARTPDGNWIARSVVINELSLAELKQFDVGRIKPGTPYGDRHSRQTPADGAHIPTFEEVVALANASGKTPRFNLETKLSPDKPHATPDPETFARLTVTAIRAAGLAARATIQSFDWRTLVASRKLAPEIETVCLTSDARNFSTLRGRGGLPSPWLAGFDLAQYGGSVPRLVQMAGCGTWSPRLEDLTSDAVAEAHALGLKVVPWTVNTRGDIARTIDMKADGLITDYPDLAREVMAEKGLTPP